MPSPSRSWRSHSTSNPSSRVTRPCRQDSVQESVWSFWHWLCLCPSCRFCLTCPCLCPASRDPWVRHHQRPYPLVIGSNQTASPWLERRSPGCVSSTWQWLCTCDGANASLAPTLTSSSNVLPNLCSYLSPVTLPSLGCFSRLQDRLGTFRLYQVLHPYSLATFVVTVIRCVQSSPRFKSIVDFSVLHCHRGTSFAQQCKGKNS